MPLQYSREESWRMDYASNILSAANSITPSHQMQRFYYLTGSVTFLVFLMIALGVWLGLAYSRKRTLKILTFLDGLSRDHHVDPGNVMTALETPFGGVVTLFFLSGAVAATVFLIGSAAIDSKSLVYSTTLVFSVLCLAFCKYNDFALIVL